MEVAVGINPTHDEANLPTQSEVVQNPAVGSTEWLAQHLVRISAGRRPHLTINDLQFRDGKIIVKGDPRMIFYVELSRLHNTILIIASTVFFILYSTTEKELYLFLGISLVSASLVIALFTCLVCPAKEEYCASEFL